MTKPAEAAEASARPTLRGWVVLALLFGVAGSNYITRSMLVTMHESIVTSIPMTDAQFGLLTSLFLVFYAAVSPLGGFLADRLGRSRVIITIMFVWSVMTWLSGYARTFPELLLIRCILGLSEGCYLPAANGLITDYHRGSTRSFAVGLHLVGTVLGGTAGGLGGYLADRHTWSYAFVVVGIGCLAYSFILLWGLRDPAREPAETAAATEAGPPGFAGNFFGALAELLGTWRFLVALVYWGLLGAVAYVVVGWMPAYMQEHFHMGQGAAGAATNGYYFIPQMFGLLIGGAWADRWSRRNPRARSHVMVIGLCGAVPFFFIAAHLGLFTLYVLALAFWGLGAGFSASNMMPVLCQISDPRYRATAFGVLNVASAVGGAVVIYWAGSLRDRHVDLGPYMSWVGASIGLGAILCVLMRPKVERAAPDPVSNP